MQFIPGFCEVKLLRTTSSWSNFNEKFCRSRKHWVSFLSFPLNYAVKLKYVLVFFFGYSAVSRFIDLMTCVPSVHTTLKFSWLGIRLWITFFRACFLNWIFGRETWTMITLPANGSKVSYFNKKSRDRLRKHGVLSHGLLKLDGGCY